MGTKKGRIFYGWYIVAAGFLVMFCSIGIVNNCSGLYIKPVCDDMGFSRGAMGVTFSFQEPLSGKEGSFPCPFTMFRLPSMTGKRPFRVP